MLLNKYEILKLDYKYINQLSKLSILYNYIYMHKVSKDYHCYIYVCNSESSTLQFTFTI